MKRILFVLLMALLLVPSQYADAFYVNNWLSPYNNNCSNSQTYNMNNCGMPTGGDYNMSYAPYNLQNPNNRVTCKYGGNVCCCTGEVWVPNAPTNFRASASGNSITLRWDKDKIPESVKEYILRWDYDSSINVNDSRTIRISANNTSYTHRNLKYNTKYYYSLSAVGKFGVSLSRVNAKTGQAPGQYVRIESVNFPNYFIRHANFRGRIDTNITTYDDSRWKLVPGLAGTGKSIESVNFPGYYLRHRNGEIWIDKNDGSALFSKDASWIIVNNSNHVHFEPSNYRDHVLRHSNWELFISPKNQDSMVPYDSDFILR